MSDLEIIEYIEIDLPRCGLTYSNHPCTASIGITGDFKCYNSPKTCQDTNNYSATTDLTVRFGIPTQSLDQSIPCIPCLKSVSIRPQESMPAVSLGTRESITAKFQNVRHNDTGFDNYISDRGFNTYLNGTLWGKFFARYQNLQGYNMRHIFGEPGQTLAQMETNHYFVEGSTGPGSDGMVTITGKDALKFLDDKKAQAPKPSNGRLLAAITSTDTSLTLTDTGVGAEYPSSGKATIGDEIVTYTRSGDAITLTARGLQGSTAESHEADEIFQEGLSYSAADPADIFDDLIFNYSDCPTTYQDLAVWQNETTLNYGRLLTADVYRPTPVRKLLSEMIQQVGIHFYTDVQNQKFKFNIIRQRVPDVTIDADLFAPDSFKYEESEGERINQVWCYYGQKNPLVNLDEDGNFKSILAVVDDDDVKLLEGLPPSIKIVRSRWIINANRPAAQDICDQLIATFGDTPANSSFAIPLGTNVKHGSHIYVNSRSLEDAQGDARSTETAVITRFQRTPKKLLVGARHIRFRAETVASRVIQIDENTHNLNLRTLHDLLYTDPSSGDVVTVYIDSGVIVGSISPVFNSFTVGDWPDNVQITIINNGRIEGAGGAGGYAERDSGEGGDPFDLIFNATNGGNAFYTRYPITMDNQGEIWSGGGGGGADLVTFVGDINYGGGGAGYDPGGGLDTDPDSGGTTEAGGTSASGGSGGDPGQDGGFGGYGGGTAGDAVDGESYITYTTVGDIQGDRVN